MLTSRGWWFLIAVFSLMVLGLFDERWTLTLLALTLFVWFLGEWFLFGLRARLALPALEVFRKVSDERGAVNNLWAGHGFHVEIVVKLVHWLGSSHVRVTDFVPFGVVLAGGAAETAGPLTGDNASLRLHYRFRCGLAGQVRFEGLRIEAADLQGFFYHSSFRSEGLILRVLPALADARGNRPTVKRQNLLPSPGLHRHLRPGSGSELLDLRDYLPGDPPKTIAWKVSARRDRLITKEFESEVPLRCTLFVDTSQSVRLGPAGQNALARLVDIAAAFAQATAASRDLSGLCLFDDRSVTATTRPARGTRHLVLLLNQLADAAGLAPASGKARVQTLLPLGYALALEAYPHLVRSEVNHVPGWLPWIWPMPLQAGRRAPFRFVAGLLLTAVAFLPPSLIAALIYLFSDPLAYILLPVPETLLAILAVAVAASAGMLYCALLCIVFRALRLAIARRVRQMGRWRKHMAALLAERYALGPGGLSLLLEDDAQCALYLQRFLAEHRVPYPVPLYDDGGRYLFASPGKIDVLARALLHAVGRGRDNEMFVLLADLLELSDDLEPLMRAVKITLARHHQVVVVCPWPPGIAPPRREDETAPHTAPEESLQAALQQVTSERLHRAFHKMRRAFARLAVPVLCAEGGDPVRLLLERLDRLRCVGLGRRR